MFLLNKNFPFIVTETVAGKDLLAYQPVARGVGVDRDGIRLTTPVTHTLLRLSGTPKSLSPAHTLPITVALPG